MNGWDFTVKYLWFIILIIITLYIFSRLSQRRKIRDFKLKEMALFGEVLLNLCIFLFFQVYVFPGNYFFSLAFIPFMIVWYFFINWLFRNKYKYIINSTILGEEFFNPLAKGLEAEITSLTSETSLIIMPDEVYKEVIHVGQKDSRWWNMGERIKHSDYYDDINRILYHPEIPELHNFTLIDAQPFYLIMKEDIPKLRRENIKLTHYMDYQLAFKQEAIADEFRLKLHSMYNQHKDKPFPLRDSLKDIQQAISSKSFTKDEETKIEEVKTDESDGQTTTE